MARRSRRGNRHCGDAAAYWTVGAHTLLCVVDGLGHGQPAAMAADAALDYVTRHRNAPMMDIVAGCDRALSSTRGVAMSLARVHQRDRHIDYVAIGNIRAGLYGREQPRILAGWPGIVGGGYRRAVVETFFLERCDSLFVYTDGLPPLIDLTRRRTGLMGGDIQSLADAVIEEFRNPDDDSAILIYRHDPCIS